MKNTDFEGIIETSDEWIVQRTGIRERHIAGDDETTVSLGTAAARAAIENAGLQPTDIDLVLLATSTPNHTFPASAVEIQRELGITSGFAFDMQAVCSGFIYAITTADLYIRGGMAKRVLVIGAETFSRILDWSDRTTCVLFGDGAGALVLEAAEGNGLTSDRGVLAANLRSDGNHKEKLFVDGGPSMATPLPPRFRWRSQPLLRTVASRRATSFFWRQWAADSPGARFCCVGKR